MGLCVTLVCSEASLKIQVNSPMRLRLKIRHGDKQTWPRYEPELQIPCRKAVCTGTVKKDEPEAKKQFVYIGQEPGCVMLGCSLLAACGQ